jgi:hypothetical protein
MLQSANMGLTVVFYNGGSHKFDSAVFQKILTTAIGMTDGGPR